MYLRIRHNVQNVPVPFIKYEGVPVCRNDGFKFYAENSINIWSEKNFYFIRYLWNELCVLFPRAFGKGI